jgi:hypothetical protein
MIQRDSLQKAAFLRDLPAMCAQFDSRVLRFKARHRRLLAAGCRLQAASSLMFSVGRGLLHVPLQQAQGYFLNPLPRC